MIDPVPMLRIARPTDELERIAKQYAEGLGLERRGEFRDHDGFDGVILGRSDWPYHFELTHHHGSHAGRAPTPEHLLVFYLPETERWLRACERMQSAGFERVASFNPYWDRQGRSFADGEGYRVVLQNESGPGAYSGRP